MKTPSGINSRFARFRTVVLIVAAVSLLAVVIWPTAPIRAAEPTTAPADLAYDVSPRQRNLLLQLADSEANIQAINKALRRTGYKVGLAYDRIESNQKGNELMDRKGGGPVRWDDFYGRTARDFYAPESWGTLHREGNGTTTDIKVAVNNKPLQRPAQFDFIYKANNDQIGRANEKIASLQHDQAALLARRQFHESEQSRLWSTLVLNRVEDQEISFRPLYRFRLKPAGSDAVALRPIIRFLRVADLASADGLQSLKTDQDVTFTGIDHRMQDAYAALQKSLADVLYAPDLKAGHREQAEELKSLCKRLAEESSVIADNYHKALDSDQAKEDSSKLQFRAELQSSLAFFAAGIAQLDQRISKTADAWGLSGEMGATNPDDEEGLARVNIVKGSRVAQKDGPAAATTEESGSTIAGHMVTVDLLKTIDIARDTLRPKWRFDGSILEPAGWEVENGPLIQIPVSVKGTYELRATFTLGRADDDVFLLVPVGEGWGLLSLRSNGQNFDNINGSDQLAGNQSLALGVAHEARFRVTVGDGNTVRFILTLDGRQAISWEGPAEKVKKAGEMWRLTDRSGFGIATKYGKIREMKLIAASDMIAHKKP